MNKTDNQSDHSPAKKKVKSHPFWRWFWLAFLFASLAYAWYSFYVPSNEVNWAEDMISAREMSEDSGKNILVFFTGEWCVPCRIMKREVFADEEVMKAINSQVVPIMIDVDDPNAQELVKHYQVGATPLTIFTDHQGMVLDYAVGKVDKAKFLEMLGNLGTGGSQS